MMKLSFLTSRFIELQVEISTPVNDGTDDYFMPVPTSEIANVPKLYEYYEELMEFIMNEVDKWYHSEGHQRILKQISEKSLVN